MDYHWMNLCFCTLVLLLCDVTGLGYRRPPYSKEYYPRRRPYIDENISYSSPQRSPDYVSSHPDYLWQQFWDAVNYNGPLEEVFQQIQPSNIYQDEYLRPEFFFSRRLPVVPSRNTKDEHEDEYNRYREYFYRRYGTNFVD
ncbi:uncharacterized protein LOC118185879 isoform X1 [Stegodyphus dumicola]|uniref:uncharacterized protein LOC118185879 isoform X1 n=1 Tax=Stegodyphus dumicola TaxID=202533 RepID=UPI0015AF8A05|nr:uncharacterized protein LOC118185879 isoform X1 [Stegodyphus dumicola]